MVRRRAAAGAECPNCGGRMDAAQDPGDDFPEVWCPDFHACGFPGCEYAGCGDDKPGRCALCETYYCGGHLEEGLCWECASPPPE